MSDEWKTLTIKNPRLGLDRLSQETTNDQFVRGLSVNSIEAIQRSGMGDSIWITESPFHDIPKFMCMDNGPGMSKAELDNKLNLFANITDQRQNHGVGAKISTLTRNPLGVVYLCRTSDGETTRAALRLDANTGIPVYRLERITEREIPEEIKRYGTAVILLGRTLKENTMLPPEESQWQNKLYWLVKAV
jgi:hypothetical protein